MAKHLSDARRSLVRAKEAANKRLEELEAERREVKASLKSLDAALKLFARSSGTTQKVHPAVGQDKQDGARSQRAKEF